MFELPEYVVLAEQMNEALHGRTVHSGSLGNKPHKFVWYNRTHDEFARLVPGRVVGAATSRGRWLFLPLDPGFVLVFGECGGRLLYHPPAAPVPETYHLHLGFDDGSALTITTQMWGAMELYEQGQERERPYVRDMRTTPADPGFTFDYFSSLVDELLASHPGISGAKRSVKSLLTQDQLIPGLGNAIAQDIMFRAGLHPRRALADLDSDRRRALYQAIVTTVGEIIRQGGRYDEIDLYGRPGGYVRLMDKVAEGKPCPGCGTLVVKIQYLGGACYLCPTCQT